MKTLKKITLSFLLFFTSIYAFCISSTEVVSQERLVRFPLWAQTDVYPGYFDTDIASDKEKSLNKTNDSEVTFIVPVKKIKEIAPFLLSGMVYGWKFDYTPSDKIRNVKEFFEVECVKELADSEKERIRYKKPWIENERLTAWIEFDRTDVQINLFNHWRTINNPRIKGVGYANLSEGFDGIKKACEDAIKNAVRNYERTKIKTKPKEIIGVVLVANEPIISVESGRYKILLDFFMQSNKIVEYKTF